MSAQTIKQYRWHLARFQAELLAEAGASAVELGDVTRSDLRRWGAGLRDVWSPATIKQAVCAVRALFRWCVAEGLLSEDPALGLVVPKVPARVQRTLTAAEIGRMLAGCDVGTVKGRRDAALVSLLVDSGLRSAEVCRLELRALNLEVGALAVVGKGGDEEMAYYGQATARRLRSWLEVRVAEPGVGTVFVSVGGNMPGRPLTPSGLRQILRRLGEGVGVARVSPHAFRRAFACIATEAGAPSRVVQALGRWGDIRQVERYTKGLEAARLYARYCPADWLENGGDG